MANQITNPYIDAIKTIDMAMIAIERTINHLKYKTCKECGANLDHGEKCDCKRATYA